MLNKFYNKVLNRKTKTFQVAIGEEGAVILLCDHGAVKSRLFLTSPEDKEVERLKTLLLVNQDASIHFYLDNLDQSYVQRTLAGVSQFNIKKLAQGRLNREVPKNYLKAFVQLGRSASGRRDWLYTFISTPLEPPISTWLDFFLPFQNIIRGIYFLPIEIYTIVEQLKEKMTVKIDNTTIKQRIIDAISLKKSQKQKINENAVKHSRWELYISSNKTGGFRQVAFQDGNIVFSRLLNNIQSDSIEVIAGNLELEIANSVEYLTRLSIGIEEEIDIYIVLASDILKAIRTEKLKASRAYMYSPYAVAQSLNLIDASGEKDKFADPAILAALSKYQRKRVKLHTNVTEKVDLQTYIVDIASAAMNVISPLLFGIIFFIMFFALNAQIDMKGIENSIETHSAILQENTNLLKSLETKLGGKFKIDQLSELLELHKFLIAAKVDPLALLQKLSVVLPQTTKIKNFSWVYNDPVLFNFNPKTIGDFPIQRDYTIESELLISLGNKIQSIEEVNRQYYVLVKAINTNFSEYKIEISDLPTNFSFQNISNLVNVKVKLYYNKKNQNSNDQLKLVGKVAPELDNTPIPFQQLNLPQNKEK